MLVVLPGALPLPLALHRVAEHDEEVHPDNAHLLRCSMSRDFRQQPKRLLAALSTFNPIFPLIVNVREALDTIEAM
jgi:hypothetical protein